MLAPGAPVVWLVPERLVEVSAAADRDGAPADADFRTDLLPTNSLLCIDAVGLQHFIFKSSHRRVRLRVDGSLATLGSVRLTFATISLRGVSRAVGEFSLLTEILYPDPAKAAPKAKSQPVTRIEFRDALIALDGKRAGATRREIARVIYGDAAVAAEWSDPTERMKDRVKRSIKRGERLMDGGYRTLLR